MSTCLNHPSLEQSQRPRDSHSNQRSENQAEIQDTSSSKLSIPLSDLSSIPILKKISQSDQMASNSPGKKTLTDKLTSSHQQNNMLKKKITEKKINVFKKQGEEEKHVKIQKSQNELAHDDCWGDEDEDEKGSQEGENESGWMERWKEMGIESDILNLLRQGKWKDALFQMEQNTATQIQLWNEVKRLLEDKNYIKIVSELFSSKPSTPSKSHSPSLSLFSLSLPSSPNPNYLYFCNIQQTIKIQLSGQIISSHHPHDDQNLITFEMAYSTLTHLFSINATAISDNKELPYLNKNQIAKINEVLEKTTYGYYCDWKTMIRYKGYSSYFKYLCEIKVGEGEEKEENIRKYLRFEGDGKVRWQEREAVKGMKNEMDIYKGLGGVEKIIRDNVVEPELNKLESLIKILNQSLDRKDIYQSIITYFHLLPSLSSFQSPSLHNLNAPLCSFFLKHFPSDADSPLHPLSLIRHLFVTRVFNHLFAFPQFLNLETNDSQKLERILQTLDIASLNQTKYLSFNDKESIIITIADDEMFLEFAKRYLEQKQGQQGKEGIKQDDIAMLLGRSTKTKKKLELVICEGKHRIEVEYDQEFKKVASKVVEECGVGAVLALGGREVEEKKWVQMKLLSRFSKSPSQSAYLHFTLIIKIQVVILPSLKSYHLQLPTFQEFLAKLPKSFSIEQKVPDIDDPEKEERNYKLVHIKNEREEEINKFVENSVRNASQMMEERVRA